MGTLLKSLGKYFLRYKKKLIYGFIFIVLSNAASVYLPLLLQQSIDSFRHSPSSAALLLYAGEIVAASLFAGIFRYLIRQTIIVVSRLIEYDLRQDFWEHMQKLPLRYFQNTSTGNIMSHATNDINAVRTFIGPAVMYSIDTGVRLLFVTILMYAISPVMTFYSFLPLPFLSYLLFKIGQKIHIRFKSIQEKFSELTTKAQENFSGIRVVKSYVREENEIKSFENLSSEYLNKNMELVKLQSLLQPALFLITGFSVIIVVWFGGKGIIENKLTLGQISAFIIYLGLLTWPMIAFGWVVNMVQQAAASMKRLDAILQEEYEISDSQRTDKNIISLSGAIELRNVGFSYREFLPPVLKNLNLSIPAGSTAAIVGATGSGKTSLINLIARLYDATEGEVLLDGKNVKTIPIAVLRRDIGLVPQETFLFSDTIKNNISYGKELASQDDIERAASISRLDKDIDSFPKGYKTIVGERGITLSGGQKQRTCLARAIVIDPKILILDDSFSAVDTNTEEEILTRLKSFMKDRTSIIISHRISTVKNADRIYVLDKGTIAEEGTHNELVALGGIYSALHNKQLLEKELEDLG
jgi:ATP-binding cassette subfamily B protein